LADLTWTTTDKTLNSNHVPQDLRKMLQGHFDHFIGYRLYGICFDCISPSNLEMLDFLKLAD